MRALIILTLISLSLPSWNLAAQEARPGLGEHRVQRFSGNPSPRQFNHRPEVVVHSDFHERHARVYRPSIYVYPSDLYPNFWWRSSFYYPWWDPFPRYYSSSPVIIEEVKSSTPVYIEREEVVGENNKVDKSPNVDKPGAAWYYCQSANEYYPRVASCKEGWEVVPYTAK